MIKKIFATLVGTWNQRENTPERVHGSEQKEEHKLEAQMAKERHEQIMHGRGSERYTSESAVEVPSTGELLGPSDSEKA